jgi:histidine ammonia-lyase
MELPEAARTRMTADQMTIAQATRGGISARRIEQMTNPQTSQLPAFPVREAGLNSGLDPVRSGLRAFQ